MIRKFNLTIYGKDEFKNTPLVHRLKAIILREFPYLRMNIKEEGKKPSGVRNDK